MTSSSDEVPVVKIWLRSMVSRVYSAAVDLPWISWMVTCVTTVPKLSVPPNRTGVKSVVHPDRVEVMVTWAPPMNAVAGPVREQPCGDATMTITSVNLYFHGTEISPRCHADEVIQTLINSGETFNYTVAFRSRSRPGWNWVIRM